MPEEAIDTCVNCGEEFDGSELNAEGLCCDCVEALTEEEDEQEESKEPTDAANEDVPF